MRAIASFAVSLTLLTTSTRAFPASQVHEYNLEHEIPEPKIIGPRIPEVVEAARRMRLEMISNLGYWRQRGLPDPVDLKDIYVFSDPKDLTVLQMLETLNPGKVDGGGRYTVLEHLKRQRAALEKSAFIRIANDLRHYDDDIRDAFSREDMLDFIFDYYCFMRYGFSVTGTWDAIKSGKTFSEVDPFMMMPQKDNAFYGKFPRVDLGEILKPDGAVRIKSKKKNFFEALVDLIKSVELDALTKRIGGDSTNDFFSRRIVILPRTTEGESGEALDFVSTLHDFSISTHELGHHINSSLAFNLTSMDRLFEEIFADWLSATHSDNPKMGEHFAKVSGEIARRLSARETLTKEETLLAAAFEKFAQKGYLRSFEEPSSIGTINRHVLLSNPYDGGDPGRAFLSNLRGQFTPRERERFDEITLHVIHELGHLPKVTASLVSFKLLFRTIGAARRKMKLMKAERQRIMQSGDPRVTAILDQAERELKSDAEEMAKIEKHRGDWKKTKAEFTRRLERRALKIVTRDGFNIDTVATLAVGEALKAREKALQARPGFLGIGLKDRPPTGADYALPELFRAYFRVATMHAPELVDRIVTEAGHAMEAQAHRMRMNDGFEELVFVRRKFSVSWALAESDIRSAMQTLRDLRPIILELKSRPEPPEKELEKRMKEYDRALERVQEFERTGSWLRMMYPSPVMQFARDAVGKLAKLSETEKKALESCAGILGSL